MRLMTWRALSISAYPVLAGHAAVAKSVSGTTVMTTVGVGAGGSTIKFLRSSRAFM